MKVLVAGAGSIGTVVGLLLSRQYHDVVLLRKRPPFGYMNITVFGVEQFVKKILVTDIYNLNFDPELVIIATQAQHTESLVTDIKSKISSSARIISMQNGLTNAHILCSNFPSNSIIVSSVWWSATLYAPNRVLYHRKAPTIFGIPDCSMATKADLLDTKQIFRSILHVDITHQIKSELRKKLMLNTVSPVLALVKQPYPEGLYDDVVRELVHIVFDEALAIAIQEGWDIKDIRLNNFHDILCGNTPVPPSNTRDRPPHKVSTQIGIEKYGGSDSNVGYLLLPFIDLGGTAAKRVYEVVIQLQSNYQAYQSDQIQAIIESIERPACPWK